LHELLYDLNANMNFLV